MRICGIREVFEEANLLIATNNFSSFSDNTWRQKVTADSNLFYDMYLATGLKPSISQLYPWSHWITPTAEKYRYNTFFYITELNSSAENALHDSKETTSLDW